MRSSMDNYYEILNSSPGDTVDAIKQNYQKLLLQLHPDKQQQFGVMCDVGGDDSLDRYHKVKKAWKVLSDESLRKEYDASWKQRNSIQQWPIHDVVSFEEFDCEDDGQTYSYSCRCGGDFLLTQTDVLFGVDYVCCGICSLCVKVEYKSS